VLANTVSGKYLLCFKDGGFLLYLHMTGGMNDVPSDTERAQALPTAFFRRSNLILEDRALMA
jgi:hypothetical protein